jgi:UDP-N-acetyl-D-glucosamine dehydrogenase
MSRHERDLRRKIEEREVRVGVLGLGYVGLPLSMAFAGAGVTVLGFDVDPAKVESIASGRSYIGGVESDRLAQAVEAGRLSATGDFTRLRDVDVAIICVPTPLTTHREPDLSFVLETGRRIAATLRVGQLVILESTTFPGTTDTDLRSILETSGLTASRDFFLAFSPEREDPGNTQYDTTKIPKVVGGVDEISGALAAALYELIVPKTVLVSSARVAEASKLTENIFRAVNIALVNELKVLFDDMQLDVREVLDAASTKPFGFMRFDPGPGWGGHCIPVDPFYLSWKAREFGRTARFIELAGEVNVEMPAWVVQKLVLALNERRLPVRGQRILVLGLAYKKNVADPRESPAFEILSKLHELGADVCYHDPFLQEAPSMRTWPDLPPMHSVDLSAETLQSCAAVVLVTDHDGVDYELVERHAPLIVDTRGVFRQPRSHIVRA